MKTSREQVDDLFRVAQESIEEHLVEMVKYAYAPPKGVSREAITVSCKGAAWDTLEYLKAHLRLSGLLKE